MRGFKKPISFLLIFFSMTTWIFSGWPQILNYPPLPEIAEAANAPGDYLIRRNDLETGSITTSNFDDTSNSTNNKLLKYRI